jgi:hypothetical protein
VQLVRSPAAAAASRQDCPSRIPSISRSFAARWRSRSMARPAPSCAASLAPASLPVYLRSPLTGATPCQSGLLNGLQVHGAPPRAPDEEGAHYLERQLPRLTVPFRHGRLHRYGFVLVPHARAIRLPMPVLPAPRALAESV